MSYRFSLRISVAHFCHWKMTKSWTLSFHSLPMKWPALNQSLKEINACRPCTNSQDSAIQPDTTTSFNFFPRWDYSRQIISLLELYPVSSIWEKKIFLWNNIFLQHYQDGYYERLFMKCNYLDMRGTQAYGMEMFFWIEGWVTSSGTCF